MKCSSSCQTGESICKFESGPVFLPIAWQKCSASYHLSSCFPVLKEEERESNKHSFDESFFNYFLLKCKRNDLVFAVILFSLLVHNFYSMFDKIHNTVSETMKHPLIVGSL